jgi:hypothetical protein
VSQDKQPPYGEADVSGAIHIIERGASVAEMPLVLRR